jgi:hypothetical protein
MPHFIKSTFKLLKRFNEWDEHRFLLLFYKYSEIGTFARSKWEGQVKWFIHWIQREPRANLSDEKIRQLTELFFGSH